MDNNLENLANSQFIDESIIGELYGDVIEEPVMLAGCKCTGYLRTWPYTCWRWNLRQCR